MENNEKHYSMCLDQATMRWLEWVAQFWQTPQRSSARVRNSLGALEEVMEGTPPASYQQESAFTSAPVDAERRLPGVVLGAS